MRIQTFSTSVKVLLICSILFLTGCTPESQSVQNCVVGTTYGFWGGLWHGTIAGITWFISLFDPTIAVYSVNNTGGWYDFGFVIGIGAFGGLLKFFAKLIVAIANDK